MKVVHSFNELYAGSAVQPIRNTNDYIPQDDSGVPKQQTQASTGGQQAAS